MDNHPPLAREELEPLVEDGCTLAEIGKRLGRPPEAVRRAIARSGLPQPIEIRRRLIDEALAAGRNTLCAGLPAPWANPVCDRRVGTTPSLQALPG
jgi:hypothetical protein